MPGGLAVVADASELCRVGFAGILNRPKFSFVVSEVGTFATLIDSLEADSHELLLVDSHLPGMNGFAGVAELRDHYPDLKITLTVESATTEILVQCLSVGLNGCIAKSLHACEIEDAIEMVIANKIYISAPHHELCSDSKTALTPRQLIVMEALADGKSNKQIARELGITEGTVKVHVNAAYRALGVHNRVTAAAVLRGLRAGSQVDKASPPHLGLWE